MTTSTTKNPRFYVFIFVFFLLMGFAAFFGGGYILIKNIQLKLSGIETTGIFTGYEVTESEQTDRNQPKYGQVEWHYHKIFKYAVNGDTLVSKTVSAGQETDFMEGDEAVLVYSATDPGFMDLKENISGNIVVGIITTAMGIVVLLLLFFIRRHFRKAQSVE